MILLSQNNPRINEFQVICLDEVPTVAPWLFIPHCCTYIGYITMMLEVRNITSFIYIYKIQFLKHVGRGIWSNQAMRLGCKALGESINITKADLNNKIGNTHSIVETQKNKGNFENLQSYKQDWRARASNSHPWKHWHGRPCR